MNLFLASVIGIFCIGMSSVKNSYYSFKEIIQAPIFAKQKKKLHKQQIIDLDEAVKSVSYDPSIGDMKVGDLQGIRVYKCKSKKQPILLAYEVIDSTLYLYTFGSHENFYRELKKYLQH